MLKSCAAIANAIRTAVGGLLQVTGPSAGTTRTMTVPDANFTAARTDAGQAYLWNNLRYGYRNNPLEIEARDAEIACQPNCI